MGAPDEVGWGIVWLSILTYTIHNPFVKIKDFATSLYTREARVRVVIVRHFGRLGVVSGIFRAIRESPLRCLRKHCENIMRKNSVNVGDDLPKAPSEGELSTKLTERVCEILCFWSLGG